MPLLTDPVVLQHPPPYGSPAPYSVLIIPALDIVAAQAQENAPSSASYPRTPSFHSTVAALRLTSLQAAPSTTPLSRTPRPPPREHQTRYRAHSVSTPRPRYVRSSHRPSSASHMSAPSGSPPPYSLTPPELHPSKRAASSPHLRLSYSRTTSLSSHSRHVFSDHARPGVGPTSDADESGTETDDGVFFRASAPSLADTLRHRLLGNGSGREDRRLRTISTAPGALCAGETETEGEDSPRNLPTARITRSSLSQQFRLPPSTAWIVPILFQLFRLLAVVPAFFGTLWNIYHIYCPPDGLNEWRVDYSVCVLWSLLTGWQCLQITTGLLKRWRVYYSPLATLIRLLALQAICWPATHLTLSILNHTVRPLVCWAAIGTTTCCSRSIQLWVTSNIIIAPTHPQEEEHLRKGRHRRWDWGQVGAKCALPAGIVYLVMAWALVLRKELMGC